MNAEAIGDWRRTHYSVEVSPELDGKEAIIFGWVKEIRDLGNIRFLILQDREGTVQVTIHPKKARKKIVKKLEMIQRQYSIGVKGVVKRTRLAHRKVELVPEEIRIFGLAQHPLPLDVTGRTPSHIKERLDARALDLCKPENRAVFKIRHTALAATRDFLSRKGFIEVHTPRIIATATEGGAALFPVTYFEKQAFLAQSPQLYKEELILGFEKVFEIGPFFRAEESHTRRHISEFISIDVEQAFASSEDVMHVLEDLTHQVCKLVKAKCTGELQMLKHDLEVPKPKFIRLTYDEIISELEDCDVNCTWGEDIPTPALRTLGELHPHFYFITDWPRTTRAFYIKPKDDDQKMTEGFDLMWRWVELASGGSRVSSRDLLVSRLKECELDPESFKHHLKAFDFGMPPHAGWAIGLERLMMMLTGKENIREVVLFPRDRFRIAP